MKLRSLEEAEQALQIFVPLAKSQRAKYTLDRVRQFMNFLDNPQDKIQIIHVAGTSGKTSTCYYLAAMLKQAGLKVGLTVSPHVDKVSERLQINGQPVPDAEFAKALAEFIELVKKSGIELTYFELLMAMAYWYFAKVGVQATVIETGLGGLLDASNVATAADKTCVITDIGLDHTEVLGNTTAEIAAQKAGIIHAGNNVFMLRQSAAIEQEISDRCHKVGASLNVLSNGPKIDFLPLFQQRNFSLAERVVDSWLTWHNLSVLTDRQKIEAAKTAVPARMEIIKSGEKTLVLDGAHNAQKMQAFVDSFKSRFSGRRAAVLLSFKQGKDYDQALDELIPIADKLVLTNFTSLQDMPFKAVPPEEVAKLLDQKGFANYEIQQDATKALVELRSSQSEIVVVTGSLYLVAAVHRNLN